MERRKSKKRKSEDQNPLRVNLGRPVRKPAAPRLRLPCRTGCLVPAAPQLQQCSTKCQPCLVAAGKASCPGSPSRAGGRAQPVHKPLGWAQSWSHAGGRDAQPSCCCFPTWSNIYPAHTRALKRLTRVCKVLLKWKRALFLSFQPRQPSSQKCEQPGASYSASY